MVFQHLEDLEAHKHAVEDEITEEVLKHTDALNLLCSIPGIDVTAAAAIIAEIGTDMSSFPDSQQFLLEEHALRGCMDHGISPEAVSFRLVLEGEAAERSEAGNDCVGPEDSFHHLHSAENRHAL